jgi:hypothetical protein
MRKLLFSLLVLLVGLSGQAMAADSDLPKDGSVVNILSTYSTKGLVRFINITRNVGTPISPIIPAANSALLSVFVSGSIIVNNDARLDAYCTIPSTDPKFAAFYAILKDQLIDISWDNAALTEAFKNPNNITYIRCSSWGGTLLDTYPQN